MQLVYNHSCHFAAAVVLQLAGPAESHSSHGITMWIADKQRRWCTTVGIGTIVLLTVTIFTKWGETGEG